MKNSPLVNLCLLEGLQGKKQADELDLFIPFLADILEEMDNETIDKITLQNAFKDRFKIVTPLGALNTLLTRAKNLGLLVKLNKQYFVQFEEINKLTKNSKSKKEEIKLSISSIVDALIEFSANTFDQEIDIELAEKMFSDFIRKNISIFVDSVDGKLPEESGIIKNKDYLMASFIKYIHDRKRVLIPDITNVIKGTLLANYLTFADKTSQKNKFNNITIYLDTPIVLGLLGWDGPARKKSIHEFLELIIDLNANIKIFDVTLREIKGVFSFWIETLRHKKYEKLHEMTRQLFQSRNTTPEQMNSESVLLESNLKKIGIKVDNDFVLNQKYCCDETKLETFFRRAGFKRTGHDTTCVSRVFNSREGKSINSLNQHFSIFITPNQTVESISNRFFKNNIEKNSIQVVASEKWLTTFLWLKHPEHFKSLPFDMLLSDAYSALSSDDVFWEGFLKRFKHLKSKGDISEDDFNLVRWNNSLFGMVKHASVLSGDDIADDDIYEMVEEIKEKNVSEKNKEIKSKDEELEAIQINLDHTTHKITKTIKCISHSMATVITFIYSLLWVAGTYYFGPNLEVLNVDSSFQSHIFKYGGLLVILLLAVIGAVYIGISLYNRIYNKLSGYITKQYFLKI